MPYPRVLSTSSLISLVLLAGFTALLTNRKQEFRDFTCKFILEPAYSVDTKECNRWLQEIEEKVWSKIRALNPAGRVDFDNYVFNYTDEKNELNETAVAQGEAMLNAMKFSEYDETNLCDVWKGVEVAEFDENVDAMADSVNMPENLTRVIKKAKNFRKGKASALDKITFRNEMGALVFGRFVIARNGDEIDFAYSLHSVRYVVKKRQLSEETRKYAAQLQSLADSMDNLDASALVGEIIGDASDHDITIPQRKAFLAFFHKQAIDKFSTVCTDTAKKVFRDDDFALAALGITSTDKTQVGEGKN